MTRPMEAEGGAATVAAPGPWPRRLALWTFLAALPLVVFGGSVTTLRAGMAIDGWWVLEPGRGDYFLLAYPLEHWLRDPGTFVEHTHRLFGVLVGILAVLCAALVWLRDRRKLARVLALGALVAVCVQGALGGLRVLENSPNLAFVHGALAQAVLAVLGANALVHSAAWRSFAGAQTAHAGSLRRAASAALVATYAEIVVGAWLRHTGSSAAMALHVVGVVAVLVAVLTLASRLEMAAREGEAAGLDRSPLRRTRRNLVRLLAVQIALGMLAALSVFVISGGFTARVSAAEMVFATLHVLFGALLLVACAAAALWSFRLGAVRAAASELSPGSAALGGAR
ncbi:MAG TPA: COX15/CtaA family protein [Planctomycetota bacterium]|nr:COX15/CtaA family protein [Planctomycetota bacterium]